MQDPLAGEWVPPNAKVKAAAPTVLTVAELTRLYLDDRAKASDRPTQKTLEGYDDHRRRHIEPTELGRMKAKDVTWKDVRDWQNALDLGANSVIKIRSSVLAPAFKWALSPQSGPLLEGRNPVLDARPPKADHTHVVEILYDPDEYATYLTACRAVDPNWADMVTFVATTGLRQGEYEQLRGEWVFPSLNMIKIAERVTRTKGGRMVEAGGKNGHTRDVPVPELVMQKIIVPRLTTPDAFVFTNGRGRQWVQATEYVRWDKAERVADAHGLQRHITAHSMRHGYRRTCRASESTPTRSRR